MKDRLKIKELEAFNYIVESQSAPDRPYMVNLCERVVDGRAHGVCNCTHFQTVCAPNLKRHGKWIPYRKTDGKVVKGVTECKHISACRNHMMLHITMPMLAKMRNGIGRVVSK